MIKGIQIDYKLKKNMSSRFNQKMFGRITSMKSRKEKMTGYYIPGVLHNIPFYRIFDGRIFVATCNGEPDFDPVMNYFEKFEVSSTIKEDNEVFMRTGREKWIFHTKERGVEIDW